MDALEKARIALREYIQANKEKVRVELEKRRKKSTGIDFFQYSENFEKSFSFEMNSETKSYRCYFDDLLNDYKITLNGDWSFSPPKNNNQLEKKDSEISSESFFLIL